MNLLLEEVIKNNKKFIDEIKSLTKIKEVQESTKIDFWHHNINILILKVSAMFKEENELNTTNKIKFKYAIDELIIDTGIENGISQIMLYPVVKEKYNYQGRDKYEFAVSEITIKKKIPNSPLEVLAKLRINKNTLTLNLKGSNFWNEIRFSSDGNVDCSAGHPSHCNKPQYRNHQDLIDTVAHLHGIKEIFNYDKEKALGVAFNNKKNTQEEVDLLSITSDLTISGVQVEKFGVDVLSVKNGLLKKESKPRTKKQINI